MHENLAPGTRLADRYLIVRRVGLDTMGTDYLAEDSLRGMVMVVLRYPPSAVLSHRDSRRALAHDAGIYLTLHDPHVVQLLDVAQTKKGRPQFLVLEYVDGPSLADVLREHLGSGHTDGLPAVWLVTLLTGVAVALQKAHERGIVHGDIRPANIRLTGPIDAPGTMAKLAGFNLAANAPAAIHRSEQLGAPEIGGYVAPEAALDLPITPASDVYSLGASLYHVLAGRCPHSGSGAQLLAGIRSDDPAPMQGVEPAVEAVIRRAMAKVPEQRFASPIMLMEALAAAVPAVNPESPTGPDHVSPQRRHATDAEAQAARPASVTTRRPDAAPVPGAPATLVAAPVPAGLQFGAATEVPNTIPPIHVRDAIAYDVKAHGSPAPPAHGGSVGAAAGNAWGATAAGHVAGGVAAQPPAAGPGPVGNAPAYGHERPHPTAPIAPARPAPPVPAGEPEMAPETWLLYAAGLLMLFAPLTHAHLAIARKALYWGDAAFCFLVGWRSTRHQSPAQAVAVLVALLLCTLTVAYAP